MNQAKFHVLVIDDEIRICQSIKSLLESKGLTVKTALSVRDAVALCRQKKFDIFLIDKNLPGVDGFVFMDYAMKHHPGSLSIMMTGNASVDSAISALRKGAYDYLRKPFKFEELINVVFRALDQKRLEEENQIITRRLNASEKRYRDLIQHSPDLIFVLDGNGEICFANDTVVNLLGYPKSWLERRPFSDIVSDAHLESVNDFLKKRSIPDPMASDAGLDIQFHCSHGKPSERRFIDVEIRKSKIILSETDMLENENVEQICIVGRDIGFRKAFEEQMVYSQKMEAVASLAGGVAHDFNNLLMGIRGYTTMLKAMVNENDALLDKVISIEKSVSKGANITSQLLNFARGGGQEETHVGNINRVIKDALELFAINRKDVLIQLNLNSDLWRIEMDACRMEQVFLNLFINAGHAMPKGGGIQIQSENLWVDETLSNILKISKGNYIKVSIQDTGHGISPEHRQKIFDPFFTTKKKGKGSGLGLASAYGIVKNHNGTISVSSKMGKGTRFDIYLRAAPLDHDFQGNHIDESKEFVPTEVNDHKKSTNGRLSHHRGGVLKNELPSSKTASQTIASLSNHSMVSDALGRPQLKALAIDDDGEALLFVRQQLEAMGMDVMTATNGREGVQVYMEHLGRIDLIVLDMVMPGMSGVETFRYIRKLNPDAKILVLSGYNHEDDVNRMVTEGGWAFLMKPFASDVFNQKINDLIALKDIRESAINYQ